MNLTLCSPKLFDEQAGVVLREREIEFNLMLGILRQILTDPTRYPGDNLLAIVQEGGKLLLAALRTPPFKVLIYTDGDQPQALLVIARYLAARDSTLPGVLAEDDVADQWSHIWRELTGARECGTQRIRLHALYKVNDVPGVSGEAHWAAEEDAPALLDWICAFHREATPGAPTPDASRLLARNMSADTLLIWHDDGQPVSMAGLVRPTGNCISVSLVYTPPEMRRRGYATALVAEASRRGLARGYECCTLYTDLANPTSNSIYRKIGYIPVSDWKDIYFAYEIGGKNHAE